VIELSENLQQLVVTDVGLNDAGESQKEKATCSEAAASKAPRGNTDSHNISNIIDIGCSTTSLSTSVTTSSDMDDISLDRVYANLQKSLSPSLSTKHKKKLDNDTFVPMYPSVEEGIHDMQQRRINACVRLPADHPLQSPMIEPLQSIPADAEVIGDQTRPESANHEVSLSPSKPTTPASDPFVIQDLINHYSGELPSFEPNLQKASEIASGEITSESPQQQEPDLQMTPIHT